MTNSKNFYTQKLNQTQIQFATEIENSGEAIEMIAQEEITLTIPSGAYDNDPLLIQIKEKERFYLKKDCNLDVFQIYDKKNFNIFVDLAKYKEIKTKFKFVPVLALGA